MGEAFGGGMRIEVGKERAAHVAAPMKIAGRQGPTLAVEAYPLLALRRLAEQLQRVHAPSARRIDRANQAFVTDGTAMSEAVDRLEMARQVGSIGFASFCLNGVFFKKKSHSKPQQVYGPPEGPRSSLYLQ